MHDKTINEKQIWFTKTKATTEWEANSAIYPIIPVIKDKIQWKLVDTVIKLKVPRMLGCLRLYTKYLSKV